MGFSLFGKTSRRRISKKTIKKAVRKPSAKIIRQCKKYKIKVTVKRGHKRVYKSLKVLKKQIAKAKKKARKIKKSSVRRRRVTRRRFAFGSPASFTKPEKYGYDEKVKIVQGPSAQSSSVVTMDNN